MSVDFYASRTITLHDIGKVNEAMAEDKNLVGKKPIIQLCVYPCGGYNRALLECNKKTLGIMDYNAKTNSFSAFDLRLGGTNLPEVITGLIEKYSDIKIVDEHQYREGKNNA